MDGYREWSFVDTRGGVRLQGAHSNAWESPYAKSDVVPNEHNAHGIYAYNTIIPLLSYLVSPTCVVAKVLLGGKVIEHTDGRIRGEFCRIKYFITSPQSYDRVLPKIEFYRLPLIAIDIGEMVQKYLQEWENINAFFIEQVEKGPEKPEDFKVPGQHVPPPVTLEVPKGMTDAQVLDIVKKYILAKEKQRQYYRRRKQQGG